MPRSQGILLSLLVVTAIVAGPGKRVFADEVSEADEKLLKENGVAADGPGLVDFFRKRCLTGADRDRLEKLVGQLGNRAFARRRQAARELIAAGPAALPFLRQGRRSADPEIAREAQRCITAIERGPGLALPAAAARLLARQRPEGAVEVLLRYLPDAANATVADEILAALFSLADHKGKDDRHLLAALSDPEPIRRAAAAYVLGRRQEPQTQTAVGKLLADPAVTVRLRAAQGLAAGKERRAVPVLIELLAETEEEVAWQAEELLQRLAGEEAPGATAGDGSAAARKKYRDAWAAWWRDHGGKIDLARLRDTERLLGLTLVIEWNTNRVWECGRDGKVRWQLKVNGPMDAQVLPGNRVLIAEANTRTVTERDLKGNILWQQRIDGEPINCRRLPNGNTWVGARDKVLEINRQGQVVRSHPLGFGYVHAVRRLRNGHHLFLTNTGVIGELDAAGKKVRTITLVNQGSWGDVMALPGGKYLVANNGIGKIWEVDATGRRTLWECQVPNSCGLARLPSGNTVLGCGQRVVEVNRAGKVVWQTATEGGGYARRVHRR
jgi:hypothetical protein